MNRRSEQDPGRAFEDTTLRIAIADIVPLRETPMPAMPKAGRFC